MLPDSASQPDRPRSALVTWILKLLAEPRLRGADADSGHFVDLHRQILLEKPIMLAVFREFYDSILRADQEHLSGPGARVELGAGSSIFGDLHPGVISTDIKLSPILQAVVDAQSLPFRRHAVRAYYGINCFHHFPDPDRFFDQLMDLLPPGGGCVLIEPYHGPVARFFYTRLFETERFDQRQAEWTSQGAGPMTGANQAMSYIVFHRDAAAFARRYPDLEVVMQLPMTNYVRYILSGGLNFRALIPAGLNGLVRTVERILAPLARWCALHQMIVLRKRDHGVTPDAGAAASAIGGS